MKNLQYYIWKTESVALSVLIIMLILFVLPVTTLRAQESPKVHAKVIAEQFLLSQKVQKSSFNIQNDTISTYVLDEIYQSPDSAINKLYGFKNDQMGFVFILENNGIFLIVGYSENGYYDSNNIPDALDALFKTYEQSNKLIKTPIFKSEMATCIVEPLLDKAGINLNQFNHENVGDCPSGCVVTAMAQIMSYYKYPNSGTGSNCYTHSVYGELCADFANTTYNWINPTDDDYKLLSYHIGVSMNMNYCGDQYGSIPGTWEYADVLQKNFKYYTHSGSSESFYLINELDNSRPIYCELPGDPGHAVVLDGYDNNEFFHINFGWGGAYNGYFMLNNNSFIEASIYTFGSNITSFNASIFMSPTPFKTNSQDSLALVNFHNSMNAKTGWDLTKPVVNWPGVIIMNERVISLILNNSLEGEIPADIGNLTALQNFSIRGNISGSFPTAITNLTSLKGLSINYYNTSSVSLPSEIGNLINLESLSITSLVGNIPKTIGNLTKLKSLTLSGGELTGEIPEEIYSFTNLEGINLTANQLSGILSPKIGQLIKLKVVALQNNKLSGPLPVEIGNLTEITEFFIANNQFSGTIPETIGNWTKLVTFSIYNNAFEGMLPNAFGNFTQFKVLQIYDNKLTGLPESIGNLTDLEQIVANNNLIESIPASISKLSKLYQLHLQNNKLTTLPDLGTMPALWDINLSNNQISALPESIGKLSKVSSLSVGGNELTNLPSSIENLSTLRSLYLGENKLSFVPIGLALLSNLKEIYLQNNQISRPLPPMKHLGLRNLWLQGNKLIFSDIATSGMPDDLDWLDFYEFYYFEQAKVPLTDSVFSFEEAEPVSIDIRTISRLSHPQNVYEWYKDDKAIQSGAILKIDNFTNEHKGSYYCRITNLSYQNVFAILVTEPLTIISKDDLLLLESFITTSRAESNTFTDQRITLTLPTELRGDITWQASTDSINWFDVSENMTQLQIKQNILSFDVTKLVVEPKSTVFFQYVLKEGTCDPLISDKIKINPYGTLLLDTILNVQNEAITISKDSIEIVFPANFTNKDFRLTIEKLSNPPAAPNSVKLSSVYDVNVSCGSILDIPLLIKFKNIDKKKFDMMNIDKYKPVYFDDKNQKWETYSSSILSLKDSTLVFETNHLTKLSWWWDEDAVWGYTHILTKGNVNVIYKYGENSYGTDGGEANYYNQYEEDLKFEPYQSWHNTNYDPDNGGNPLMIQDIAEYTNQIIDKFSSLGLATLLGRTNVYVRMINAQGSADAGGGYFPGGCFFINPQYSSDPATIRTTTSHEYMHIIQDKYMLTQTNNYFWTEATAPLTDRMVWDEKQHEFAEPELLIKQALTPNPDGRTLFDILSCSWDAYISIPIIQKFNYFINTNDANLGSLFLHYMRSFRSGEKLKPEELLKETSSLEYWRTYLDGFIQNHLKSTIGDEYEEFVKYIIEGSNPKFTLLNTTTDEDPLKYFRTPSAFITDKIFKFNNEKLLKDSVQLEIPYLASKMVQMYNVNNNQKIIVKYKRKSAKNENLAVYFCKYDSDAKKMILENISENDSSIFIIDKAGPDKLKRKHIAYLLFVNKDKDETFNVDYELTMYNIPEFSMLDSFIFSAGDYGTTELSIHTITDGTTEKLDQFYIMPQVYRIWAAVYYSPMSYNTQVNDSTIITHATSDWFEQTITYNFTNGKMTIYDRENWGGITPTSYLDMREITIVLNNVWLTPAGSNSTGYFYSFSTKSTEETKKVIQSISYTRKFTHWPLPISENNPMTTYTYLRTNYPDSSNEFNYIKFSLRFFGL